MKLLINIFIQTVFFIAVFVFISWIRELKLLPTNGDTLVPDVQLQAVVLKKSDSSEQLANLISSRDFVGQATLFYFWAPWCSVCKLSMPNLQEFHLSQVDNPKSKQVKVVAVALSYESEQEVINYLQERKYGFTSVLGDQQVSDAFKISAFPTYYLIDKNGYLVSKSMGYSTELGMILRSFIL